MHRAAAIVITIAIFAGCAAPAEPEATSTTPPTQQPYTAPERVALPFNVTGAWSQTLVKGTYGILPAQSVFVSVNLPPTELGASVLAPEGPQAHLGLFLPDVPGGTKVPVIVDAGPYYSASNSQLPQNEGDTVATEPANRLGRFLIENFVPHGYAVAQVSVMGSGDSNHCFDMFGAAEQAGVNAAVEWLGTQSWSNGNVSLIGRSYDGSTPWMAATFGNPHLKTIVPISGLHGLQALVTQNGSSEQRVLTFHNVIYGQFGIDGDAGDIQHICPDYLTATPMGAAAFLTGDDVVPMDPGYWHEREFLPRVLQNYKGSVYFIHGLQDFNVDPHMISPAFKQLRAAGLEVKGLFGQWQHNYPDRPGEHCPSATDSTGCPSVRYDWAEDLLEWFNHYLKGIGPTPQLAVEMEDTAGRWHVEESFPPPADFVELPIGGADGQVDATSGTLTFQIPPLEGNGTALGGHIYLDAHVQPTGPNGQLTFRVSDGSGRRLAFGTMDFRYRNGSDAEPVVPGMAIPIRVESQPFDFFLEPGSALTLEIMQSGEGYLPSPSAAPFTLHAGQTTLLLPVLRSGPEAYFTPPAWAHASEDETGQP